MARDEELDRLNEAHQLAFHRKQDAHYAKQVAWERREFARAAMDREYRDKRVAYDQRVASWEEYISTKYTNAPLIDQAKASIDELSRKQTGGQEDVKEARIYISKRRRLIHQIRSARERYVDAKTNYERSEQLCSDARNELRLANDELDRRRAEFRQAKQDYDSAAEEFRVRLESIKAESKRRHEDRLAVAIQAGIGEEHFDNFWVSYKSNGSINIYFGGEGEPGGPGHGHYSMNTAGKVTYKREPFEPHGRQNFTGVQRLYADVIDEEVKADGFSFYCRFRGYDACAESSVDELGRETVEVYYGPNGPFGPGNHRAIAYRDDPHAFVSDHSY